ncbi:hypothetical protein [Thermocladium modestius]|nr:hypothetical protein [Thermocladium modestius]
MAEAAAAFMVLSLGVAAFQDIRGRVINDLTWFIAAPGVALAIWTAAKSPPIVIYLYVLDAAIGIALAAIIWVTKSMGEADAIGIALISTSTVPALPPTPLYAALNSPVIASLINSMLLTTPFIIWNIAMNTVRAGKCLEMSGASALRRLAYLLFLTCERSSVVRRKPWAYSPGRLSLRISDEAAQASEGREYVLVSYNMPYIAYMFLGYVIYLLIGDLVLKLIVIA